ncbi:MAG: metalloregulator ArsR/SmtB family transcription factor, partial [Pseudomonadota bacterium]|nr:metalloregulator ArsR/SmtB family transcription factor [Pseudomonadota bacterium]
MTLALDIVRALADATRLRVFSLLRSMELSVGELAQVLGQSQPRVSRHVKILCDAGLAERRKEGSWVFVALGTRDRVAPVAAMLDALAGVEPDHWAVADAARLAA